MRDPESLRAYARRDWASFERDQPSYWREQKRLHGPAVGILIAAELRRHVIAMRPDWPSEREREEDLAMHMRLIDVISRVPRLTR